MPYVKTAMEQDQPNNYNINKETPKINNLRCFFFGVFVRKICERLLYDMLMRRLGFLHCV